MPGDENAHLPLVVVAAALIDAGGQVLLQQRPAGRHHGGLWEFPGGKVEPGEGPIAALVRELHEELAITVAPADCHPLGFAASEDARAPGFAVSKDSRAIVLLLYAVRAWHGKASSQEDAALAWCTPDRFAGYPMPPLDIPLGRIVARFLSHR